MVSFFEIRLNHEKIFLKSGFYSSISPNGSGSSWQFQYGSAQEMFSFLQSHLDLFNLAVFEIDHLWVPIVTYRYPGRYFTFQVFFFLIYTYVLHPVLWIRAISPDTIRRRSEDPRIRILSVFSVTITKLILTKSLLKLK